MFLKIENENPCSQKSMIDRHCVIQNAMYIIMILISSHNIDACISESNIQKFIQKILIKNVHTYTRQTKVL